MTVPAVVAAQSTAALPKTPVDWNAMQTEAVVGDTAVHFTPLLRPKAPFDILRYAQ